MNTRVTIQKILVAVFWICIGGGMLTLLIAAISKKNRELCSDFSISIKSNQDNFFVDEKDITRLLTTAVGADLKGRKITEINLSQLEQLLEENVWIRDAEMWFDNLDVLHISISEREPVARIFTSDGNTFYIDSSGFSMPLSDKLSARIPVFTNFPKKKMMNAKDSLLLHDIKKIAVYIMNDPFWMSQVAQIDISEERNFDMIPVVGNHLVKLGNGNDISKKFNRLMLFYKQVLSKSGFDVYSTVDVQYAGQVVGTKRGTEKNSVDSVQLRLNVEKLLKQQEQMQNENPQPLKGSSETDIIDENNNTDQNALKIEKPNIKADSARPATTSLRATIPQPVNPNNVKTKSMPKTNENKPGANKPKAVMPKKNYQ